MKAPGAYIWRGDLTEGFLRCRCGGLIFGGAYTLRTIEELIFGILGFCKVELGVEIARVQIKMHVCILRKDGSLMELFTPCIRLKVMTSQTNSIIYDGVILPLVNPRYSGNRKLPKIFSE